MSTSSGSWRAIEDPGELLTINPKRFSRSSSSTFLSFFRERERERICTVIIRPNLTENRPQINQG